MRIQATILALSLLAVSAVWAGPAAATDAAPQTQTISREGTRAAIKGAPEYFTGDVRVDPLFPANDTAHYSGAYVTFEPGARTNWHTHPAGQHIVVISGVGRTGVWGGPVVEFRAGDVAWCPIGVKHWHGAAPTTAMTHLVVTGSRNGKAVEWLEKVTAEQYNAN